ncbi:MAG: phytoene/squalene synthase family protein [Marinibacterium sp.]
MTFDAGLTACADLVRRGDPDRFLAVMATPVAARARLFPIYAMNVEIARAPWVTAEPLIAEMRLQWWRDALAEIAAGGPARAHEVTTPLARAISPAIAAALDALVEARRWDIHREPFADPAALSAHLDRGAGTLLWAAAATLGDADGDVARNMGRAMGLANWLCAVPDMVARGLAPLPDPSAAGIRALAEDGLDRLATARTGRRHVSRPARPALLAAWMAGPILRRALRRPDRVARGNLAPSGASRRLRLMVQAARG